MKLSGKIKGIFYIITSLILISLAVCCLFARVPQYINGGDNALLMAAALTISKGNYDTTFRDKDEGNTDKNSSEETEETQAATEKPVTSSDFSTQYYNTFSKHKGATKYPVYTKQYTVGGKKYQNFYVKNNTNYNLNIGKVLNSKLGFTMDDTNDVQVLIYHTHTSESYLDCDVGYYYSDFYPRTSDNRYNVTKVGDAIAKELEKAGIGVVHDTTIHDKSYTGSYQRSRQTIESYLKKYPKIKVTLDIHRDSIGSDTYKVKPTFSYKGKKGAQIMIMSGYDPTGQLDFPNWDYNLRFALRLQQACETKFGGMTRPLDFGNFAYNMNVNTGSLLVEVGTDSNTLEEAVYSGKLLGKGLVQVLQNNT